jgi:hypothetical protein
MDASAYPDWSYDGSSTAQAEGNNSDCIIRRVCFVASLPASKFWGIPCVCVAGQPASCHLGNGVEQALNPALACIALKFRAKRCLVLQVCAVRCMVRYAFCYAYR